MIVLKSLIFYPDLSGCEATWVGRIQAPDTIIPEVPATFDEEGNELTPLIPSSTEAGAITETQVKCHSYHPTQVDMLRADAEYFNTSLSDYETDILAMEAAYVPPPPEPVQVPQVITIRQAKLVLNQAGLLDDVDAAVAQADRATQIEWEYATEVKRNWPTISKLQVALGMTDSQIDDLFIQAASL